MVRIKSPTLDTVLALQGNPQMTTPITAAVGSTIVPKVPPRPEMYLTAVYTDKWWLSFWGVDRSRVEARLQEHQRKGDPCCLVVVPGEKGAGE